MRYEVQSDETLTLARARRIGALPDRLAAALRDAGRPLSRSELWFHCIIRRGEALSAEEALRSLTSAGRVRRVTVRTYHDRPVDAWLWTGGTNP